LAGFHIFITDYSMDEDALAEINTKLARIVVCGPNLAGDYQSE